MWKTVKLGEICDISIGKTPPRGEKRYWDKEKQTPNVWLSIADLTSINGRYASDSKEYVSDEGASLFKPVPRDTLVMSFKLSIGKLAFTQRELRTNEAIAALPIKDESAVSKEFLYHYLSSLDWNVIAGNDEKVKGKTLNKKKLNALDVILPPLAEQQRIVEKLDAAFAEIDRGVDIQDARLQEASRWKSSLLTSAISGEHWRTFKLNEVCTLRNGRAYKKPELMSEGKYPVLRVGNFFTSDKWYFSDLELDETKYCHNGDLLYAWSASFGARIWDGGTVIYHYHIWRVDVDESKIDKKFLFYWFEYDKELVKAAHGTGTTMMHVSKGSMEQRDVSLPSLDEQKRIVRKLDAALERLEERTNALSKSKENYAALKSAILAQELQPPQSKAA